MLNTYTVRSVCSLSNWPNMDSPWAPILLYDKPMSHELICGTYRGSISNVQYLRSSVAHVPRKLIMSVHITVKFVKSTIVLPLQLFTSLGCTNAMFFGTSPPARSGMKCSYKVLVGAQACVNTVGSKLAIQHMFYGVVLALISTINARSSTSCAPLLSQNASS